MRFALIAATSALALASLSAPAAAQMNMPGMAMPPPPPPPPPKEQPTAPAPKSMPMHHEAQPGHGMAMTGALGSYPMARESSGTAWQPDASEHNGVHGMSGDWMLMAHGVFDLVYDHQSSPR